MICTMEVEGAVEGAIYFWDGSKAWRRFSPGALEFQGAWKAPLVRSKIKSLAPQHEYFIKF